MKSYLYSYIIISFFIASTSVISSASVSMRDFYFGAIKRTPSGNYGVDVSDPDEKFTVNGTVKATKIKVVSIIPADYVFEPTYSLMPIKELHAFIKQYKHLPGISSGQRMKESGVSVGDMQMDLLSKIEELTLYVIEQDRRISELENLVDNRAK